MNAGTETSQGNAELSAVGFFSPMIGAASAVGASGGCAGTAAAFDIEGNKVVRCRLAFGRRWLDCDDAGIVPDVPSGVIYAEITHRGNDAVLSVKKGQTLPDNSLDVTHRLLYRAAGSADGMYWEDYRAAPLVMAMD